MRAVRHFGHRGYQMRRDSDAGPRHLLSGDHLVHGRDHQPGRRGEPLVQHVGLLQVQVAVPVAGRRMQQRDIRAQRGHRDQRLAGERAGDLPVLRMQPADVRAADAADRQERQSHLRGPQLGQDGGAAALRHLDRARFGRAAVAGRQTEILLETDIAFFATADRPGGHEQVHVDAVRRPDQVQAAPALPDEFADHRHRQPGAQAAAERDHRTVADQGNRVGEADSLVTRRLQAHAGPPGMLAAAGRPFAAGAG